MTDKEIILKKCFDTAKQMRIDAIKAVYNAGRIGAHIGGTLSMIEIIAVLYVGVMRYDYENPMWEQRDRFILSKGHGVLAQYAAMKQVGMISEEEFLTFKQNGTFLYAHPYRNLKRGIEFSSGSLGQGVSQAVGVAIALKKKQSNSHVYVLVGDGECNEGSIWEAIESAAHFRLDNLTVIVDRNRLQYDGQTDDIMSMGNITAKFTAFGLDTTEVNGHDIDALYDAISIKNNKPSAVIANTVKGKGISFMENVPQWHNGILSEKQYLQALMEQGENYD